MEDETRDPETFIGEALTDEELDKFLDSFDFEVDIDNELEKIEKGEVSITKQEELKMDDDAIIISSDNLNTDIILTQYIDKGFNKGRINYG